MSAADDAYKAAQAEIARVKAAGETMIDLARREMHALEAIPPEIGELANLEMLYLNNTQVADLTPIAQLANLNMVFFSNTHVSDLRPLLSLVSLATNDGSEIMFLGTAAAAKDASLRALAEIDGYRERTDKTLDYLRTLPPWPEPLPWEADAAAKEAPDPDPALPFIWVNDQVALGTSHLGDDASNDPLREALFDELQDRVSELIRISANQDDAIYREALRLQALLEGGLAAMDPVRVHLIIEALRRAYGSMPEAADRDLSLVMQTVLEIGPGLTLGTEGVNLLLDRIRENQLARKQRAEIETQARLAESIAESPLAAEEVQALARAASSVDTEDQLTRLREPLVRNWTITMAATALVGPAVEGVIGNATYSSLGWLLSNADDALLFARYWGEPVLAWLTPIIQRAQQMAAAWPQLRDQIEK